MKRKGLFVVAVIVLILLGAVVVYFWTFRKSDTSVSSKKADYEMDAIALLQSFEKDENMANEKYLGKVIVVQGDVNDISEDSLTVTIHLNANNDLSGIICSFNKSVLEPQKVIKGDNIKVKGICTGYLLDVVLNKCSLIE